MCRSSLIFHHLPSVQRAHCGRRGADAGADAGAEGARVEAAAGQLGPKVGRREVGREAEATVAPHDLEVDQRRLQEVRQLERLFHACLIVQELAVTRVGGGDLQPAFGPCDLRVGIARAEEALDGSEAPAWHTAPWRLLLSILDRRGFARVMRLRYFCYSWFFRAQPCNARIVDGLIGRSSRRAGKPLLGP